MKATLDGNTVEFDPQDLFGLNELMHIKKQVGLGTKTLMKTIEAFGNAPDDGSGIPDVFDTDEGINALRAMVWAIRLRTLGPSVDGKPLTIERACADVSLAAFMNSVEADDPDLGSDGEDDAGPKDGKSGKVAAS